MKLKNRFSGSFRPFYFWFFCLVTVLAFVFPPTADDLSWATGNGTRLLAKWFKNYNGRYLGNLAAYSLTRIPLVLPFIKGAIMTGLLVLLQWLTKNKHRSFLILSAFLLLVPSPLFIEGVVWTAGFSNYCISAALFLLVAYLLVYKADLRGGRQALRVAALCVLGFAGQLFVEHYTVFNILFAIAFIVYRFVKTKKPDVGGFAFLLTAVAGTLLMFANGNYTAVQTGKSGYQELNFSLDSPISTVLSLCENMLKDVSLHLFYACFPTFLVLLIFGILLFKRNPRKKADTPLLIADILALVAFAAVAIMMWAAAGKIRKIVWFMGVLLLAFFFFCFLVIKNFRDKKRKLRILLYFSFIVVQCGILSAVFPIGPRCFFEAYLFTILIIKEFFDEWNALSPEEKPQKICKNIAKGFFIAVVALDLFLYSHVFMANNRKIERVRQKVEAGETTIVMEDTPFWFMTHGMDTEFYPTCYERFNQYYHFPENIKYVLPPGKSEPHK